MARIHFCHAPRADYAIRWIVQAISFYSQGNSDWRHPPLAFTSFLDSNKHLEAVEGITIVTYHDFRKELAKYDRNKALRVAISLDLNETSTKELVDMVKYAVTRSALWDFYVDFGNRRLMAEELVDGLKAVSVLEIERFLDVTKGDVGFRIHVPVEDSEPTPEPVEEEPEEVRVTYLTQRELLEASRRQLAEGPDWPYCEPMESTDSDEAISRFAEDVPTGLLEIPETVEDTTPTEEQGVTMDSNHDDLKKMDEIMGQAKAAQNQPESEIPQYVAPWDRHNYMQAMQARQQRATMQQQPPQGFFPQQPVQQFANWDDWKAHSREQLGLHPNLVPQGWGHGQLTQQGRTRITVFVGDVQRRLDQMLTLLATAVEAQPRTFGSQWKLKPLVVILGAHRVDRVTQTLKAYGDHIDIVTPREFVKDEVNKHTTLQRPVFIFNAQPGFVEQELQPRITSLPGAEIYVEQEQRPMAYLDPHITVTRCYGDAPEPQPTQKESSEYTTADMERQAEINTKRSAYIRQVFDRYHTRVPMAYEDWLMDNPMVVQEARTIYPGPHELYTGVIDYVRVVVGNDTVRVPVRCPEGRAIQITQKEGVLRFFNEGQRYVVGLPVHLLRGSAEMQVHEIELTDFFDVGVVPSAMVRATVGEHEVAFEYHATPVAE